MNYKLIIICAIFSTSSYASRSDTCHSINYYDQNADGTIDHEKHTYSCISHSDWELIDLDYDGRYDVKFQESDPERKIKVDLLAPTIEIRNEY